jgi:hypothetical protein
VIDGDAMYPRGGYDLAHQVKADTATLHVPVVVLTTAEGQSCPGRLRVLELPCANADVLAAVREEVAIAALLARRRARRQASSPRIKVDSLI